MDETTSLLSGSGESLPEHQIFQDKLKNKRTKLILLVFLCLVAFFIGMAIIMTSVQAYKNSSPVYVLLILNIFVIAQVPLFLVFLLYTDKLPKSCLWAVFAIGACVIIESINTDIIVFT